MNQNEMQMNLYHVYYNMAHRKDTEICKTWKNNYKAFYNWCMQNGYCDGARVVRIDKNKGFTPSNTKVVIPKYAKNMKRLINMTKGKTFKGIRVTKL